MKTFIKLLLLAAVALPSWSAATAQDNKRDLSEGLAQTDNMGQKSQEEAGSVIQELKDQPADQVTNSALAPTRAAGDAASSGVYEENVEFMTTICRGAQTNRYIPLYGRYLSSSQRGRMIYPASLLGLTSGDKITSISFYIDESSFSTSNNVTLYLGETTVTTITSSSFTYTNQTQCYQGTMRASNYTVTFNFTTPYTYQGGNLVVDLNRNTGNNINVNPYFKGIVATSGSSYSTYSGAGAQSFLPQMTIKYTAAKGRVTGNKDFFQGITYTWRENGEGTAHTNNLAEIAKDPDQIIGMLKEVYTNKSIPGNYQRGYNSSGGLEDYVYNDVNYTGVGTINSSYAYNDTYGWNIPSEVCNAGSYTVGGNSYAVRYLNPNEYKPDYDGLTLLLLETKDKLDPATAYAEINGTGYAGLRQFVVNFIKSARVVTEAKRTGSANDKTSGTLFKIDCDKMNEFYLLAKGQLRWIKSAQGDQINSNSSSNLEEFYEEPCFWSGNSNNGYTDSDLELTFALGHMFEQFSPVSPSDEAGSDDIYQDMVNMKSFNVVHDCLNVPFLVIKNGYVSHHFRMYGEDSDPDDCQDVRDMMFFVPDYRMMYYTSYTDASGNTLKRDPSNARYVQGYVNYNNTKAPAMGLFVIHQDEIPEGEKCGPNEMLYKHQLEWYSNLDDFLPGDEQYYELWEVYINDFGVESYRPVYYRDENGNYTYLLDDEGNKIPELDENDNPVLDENNNPVYKKKPVILNRNSSEIRKLENQTVTIGVGENAQQKQVTKLIYENVYVDRTPGTQTKTYVIQGRDNGDENEKSLLSLQMSNKQDIVIPGTDPNEKVQLIGATYYSRFNPDNEKNCYSNKLQMENTATGLTASDLSNTLYFYRATKSDQYDAQGNLITDPDRVLIATGAASNPNGAGTLTISLVDPIDDSEFPVGKSDGNVAGYHKNPNNIRFNYTINSSGLVDFGDFYFWDNLTASVKGNEHPSQYFYKMELGDPRISYSNSVRVPVYKTETTLDGVVSLDQVLGDTQMNTAYSPKDDVTYTEKIQFSSKSEILRYDVYRWPEKKNETDVYYIIDEVDEDVYHNITESDIAPTGEAGNQGDSYTVSMNKVQEPQYYYSCPEDDLPEVSALHPYNTATFVDYYPKKQENVAQSYVYAPVVELFSKGYKDYKVNNKLVKRNDYNTYGGALRTKAIGKLEVNVYQPTEEEVLPVEQGGDPTLAQMSDYKWYMYDDNGNGKWYSYYNFYLNFKTLNVPEGYELYKVRAWRKVSDKSVLGEEVSTRKGRAEYEGDWYMYEDINYGDPIGMDDKTMEIATLKPILNPSEEYYLGHRSTSIAKPKNPVGYSGGPGGGTVFEYDDTPNPNHDNQAVETLIKNEMRATFGALRMKTDDCPDGIESLNAEFKVRAYFTKDTNKLIQDPEGSTNWGRDGKAQQIVPGSDFDYYIAEGSKTLQLTSENVITGIGAVKMDVNREVVGVTYVNPVGQMSSTPWQGVNIVVTRYSDGSSTTQKVIK